MPFTRDQLRSEIARLRRMIEQPLDAATLANLKVYVSELEQELQRLPPKETA